MTNEILRYRTKYKELLNNFENETIAIIGANGLLGRTLKAILQNNNVACYSHTDDISLSEFLIKAAPTIIIHCAAITSSEQMIKHPVEVLNTAIDGIQICLKYATTCNCKVIYLSSLEAYGLINNDSFVKEESLSIIDSSSLRSSYPIAKLSAEMYCKAYASQYNVDCKIVRLSSVFGLFHNENDNRLYCQIRNCILTSSDLILSSDGSTKKSVVYSLDAAIAILAIAIYGKTAEVYNVTNVDTYASIKSQAEMLFEAFNRKCHVQCKNEVNAKYLNNVQFLQSIVKFAKDIGYQFLPMTSLIEMYAIELRSKNYDYE